MVKKRNSQFPFLHNHGSQSLTETGLDGSHNCISPSGRKGTILYILAGVPKKTSRLNVSGQSAEVIAFPLCRQLFKVRDTSSKLQKVRTERHEIYYRKQVTGALHKRFDRLGLSLEEQNREISRFWQEVALEVARSQRGKLA